MVNHLAGQQVSRSASMSSVQLAVSHAFVIVSVRETWASSQRSFVAISTSSLPSPYVNNPPPHITSRLVQPPIAYIQRSTDEIRNAARALHSPLGNIRSTNGCDMSLRRQNFIHQWCIYRHLTLHSCHIRMHPILSISSSIDLPAQPRWKDTSKSGVWILKLDGRFSSIQDVLGIGKRCSPFVIRDITQKVLVRF